MTRPLTVQCTLTVQCSLTAQYTLTVPVDIECPDLCIVRPAFDMSEERRHADHCVNGRRSTGGNLMNFYPIVAKVVFGSNGLRFLYFKTF